MDPSLSLSLPSFSFVRSPGYPSLDFYILYSLETGDNDNDTTILRFTRQICQRI